MTAAKRRPKRKAFDLWKHFRLRACAIMESQYFSATPVTTIRMALERAYRLGRRHGREEAKGKKR